MKAININGTIKTYSSIPKSYGKQIGIDYMTEAQQNDLGFYNVVTPSINPSQELGDIEWDESNQVFTYAIKNRTYTETVDKLKTQKIEYLKAIYNNKLSNTDWYVVRLAEGGSEIPSNITTDRNNLRTECANKETEISALSTKASIVDYEI